jgi:ubiquinone/menaquinone biosynthesis C-methylase UbiE
MSEFWRTFWDAKSSEPGTAASGRSSCSPVELFAVLTDVCDALDLSCEDDLVDVGCGVGTLGNHLVPHVRSYTGIDFSPAALLVFRKRRPMGWVSRVGDVMDIPLPEGTADKVLVYSVLQYLPMESVPQAFDELRRISKAGAVCLCGANPKESKREWYLSGCPERTREANELATWFDPASLVSLADQHGWSATLRPVTPRVFQSQYMFDLVMRAR